MASEGSNKQWGRQDNKEKIKMFIQDEEQSHLYSPEDATGNKWFGSYSKLLGVQDAMFYENKEKYHYPFMAHLKAK